MEDNPTRVRRGLLGLVIAVCLTGGCVTNPSTGRSQFIIFSPDEMVALGESSMPELVAEYGGEVESTALREYVEQVGLSLTSLTRPEYHDLPWEITLLDSEVINAFALPGGKVFITRVVPRNRKFRRNRDKHRFRVVFCHMSASLCLFGRSGFREPNSVSVPACEIGISPELRYRRVPVIRGS